MESLLSWLHGEREVIRRAPWLAALLVIVGLALGGMGTAFLYERQSREAQQAVETAQAQRDFWKDKYDDLERRGKVPTERHAEPTDAAGRELGISWPRTLALSALIAAAMLVAVLFSPLPGQKQKPEPMPQAEEPARPLVLRPMEPPPPAPIQTDAVLAKALMSANQRALTFGQWAKAGSFELFQVASLWVGQQPPVSHVVPLSGPSQACFARLKAAILDRELAVEPAEGVAAFAQFNGRQVTEQTRVTRDNLLKYAEAQDERPAFLFPEG